jgi:AcrR family transcriptional regulator
MTRGDRVAEGWSVCVMTDPVLADRDGSQGALPAAGGAVARPGRPRDPDVDEAILSTALRMLADGGYARLTMDAVAARAGVGKASLYRRYPTKERLVLAAVRHRFEDGRPAVPDTGSLHRDVLTYMRALIRYRSGRAEGLQALAGEVMVNPELAAEFRRQAAEGMLGAFRTIVQRAVDRGELPPGTDVELLAMVPLALLHHLRLQAGEPIDERQAKRIADQIFAPLAAGSRSGAGRRGAPPGGSGPATGDRHDG